MTSTLGRSTPPSERTHLSIREVLELLIGDFPDVTISKIRFLEARGLIHPERTPSGYRKFYKQDVDRLRWILRQQRENYLPLNVIKVRLDGGEETGANGSESSSLFDEAMLGTRSTPAPTPEPTFERPRRGHPAEGASAPRHLELHNPAASTTSETEPVIPEPVAPHSEQLVTAPATATLPPVAPTPPIVVTEPTADTTSDRVRKTTTKEAHGESTRRSPRGATSSHYTAAELAVAIGTNPTFIEEIDSYGLICGQNLAGVHCYDDRALEVARLAYGFSQYGIEPRHLKALQHAAKREAELFSQAVVPLLRQRNPDARSKAHTDLDELVRLGGSLKSAFVQMELRSLTGG